MKGHSGSSIANSKSPRGIQSSPLIGIKGNILGGTGSVTVSPPEFPKMFTFICFEPLLLCKSGNTALVLTAVIGSV